MLLLFLGVVQPAARDELTGFWRAGDGGIIQFFENGDYLIRRAPVGPGEVKFFEVTGGTYTILEPGRLRFAVGSQTQTVFYRLEGDRLTILFPDEVRSYARATPPD